MSMRGKTNRNCGVDSVYCQSIESVQESILHKFVQMYKLVKSILRYKISLGVDSDRDFGICLSRIWKSISDYIFPNNELYERAESVSSILDPARVDSKSCQLIELTLREDTT